MKKNILILLGIESIFVLMIIGIIVYNTSFVSAELSLNSQEYTLKDNIYSNDLDGLKSEINPEGIIKLSKWNEEVSLEISKPIIIQEQGLFGRIFAKRKTETIDNKKIVYETTDVNLEYYIKNISQTEQGFEYEVILNNKPNTNIISMNINSENLTFYYQPALNESGETNCNETDCWEIVCEKTRAIENGISIEPKCDEQITSHRPENVVGSYAVYGNKMNNEYKTGKVFHIYRPKIIANDSSWIWGELNFKDGNLTITVDNDWLLKAKYPVIIDPTFGNTQAGGSTYIGAKANNYTSPNEITSIDSVSFYCSKPAGPPSENVGGAIYTSAGVYVANSFGSQSITSATPTWYTVNYETKPTLNTSTNYYLVVADLQYPWSYIYYDSNVTRSYSFSILPPATPATFTNDGVDKQFSVYITYTAGGEEPPAGSCASLSGTTWYVPAGCSCYCDNSLGANMNLSKCSCITV